MLADYAEINVTSGSAVSVNPGTLTADGNVEVEAISEGAAEITVTFRDGDVSTPMLLKHQLPHTIP